MKKLLACLEPFSAKKKIAPDDNLELDLGLDSLARVELVVSIEKTFSMSLPDSFGSEVFTVKDAVQKIKDLIASGPVAAGHSVKISWAEILAQNLRQILYPRATSIPGRSATEGGICLCSCASSFSRFLDGFPSAALKTCRERPLYHRPNHLSLADAPTVVAAVPWAVASQTYFLGTTDYFGGPVTSRIANVLNVIPVDMESRLYSAMQMSAFVLRRGKILCVFPEGPLPRRRHQGIQERRRDHCRELNIPLIPVAIRGTYAMMPLASACRDRRK
jgi:long-chain acyl-CoA synthetase